jgi:hypothetical protein
MLIEFLHLMRRKFFARKYFMKYADYGEIMDGSSEVRKEKQRLGQSNKLGIQRPNVI